MRLVPYLPLTLAFSLVPLAGCSDDPATEGTGGTAGTAGTAAGAAGTGTAGGGAGGAAAGSGGSAGAAAGMAGSGTAGGGAADRPSDTTQAGIEAYLAAMSYTGAGWRPETAPGEGTSLHGMSRRYFNETIIASLAAGNVGTPASPHTTGSMVVKEILEAGQVVGRAAFIRGDTGATFYCVANADGRCASGSMANVPLYGTTSGGCTCHTGGIVNSAVGVPTP